MKNLLLCSLLILASAGGAFAQNSAYSDIVLSAQGRPIAGAQVSVCNTPGLATTAASVTSNIAVLTFGSSPITAGFVAGMTLQVSGFTGGDTYLNGGTLSGGVITSGFTILSVTSTTVSFALVHANASATSNGNAFQQGNTVNSCAPLASISSDVAGLNAITQPGLTTDGLGNYAFFAAANSYLVQLSGTGITLKLKPVNLPCSGSANCTYSGTATFTGQIVPKQIANILYADQFAGADWCAKVAAAITALPSAGGIVDARGFSGAQTCAANPFAGVTKPVHLLWGNYTVTTSVKWTEAASSIVIEGIHGQPGGNLPAQGTSALQASAAITSSAVIEMGDNLASYFGMRIEWLRIHCNQNSGSTGILMRGLNEGSGLSHVSISEWITNGIKIDNSTQTGGQYALEDTNLNVSTGAGISGDGIFISSGTGITIRRSSIVSTNLQTSAAIHASSSSGNADWIYDLHVEEFTDGVLVDAGALSINGVTAGANSVNALHIKNNATVTALAITNFGNSNAKPVILNDTTTTNLSSANPPSPNGTIPWYVFSSTEEAWSDINGLHVTNPGTAANSVATLSATQTLTNKTLTSPTLTNPVINTTSITGTPASANLAATIASGAQALNTASITTATCDAGVAATATGTLSTDRVIWDFNAAPTATNKYGAFLVVYAVPSVNTVTFYTCNPSATTSTPTAMTVNWSVVR